jgi:hypothetical protein
LFRELLSRPYCRLLNLVLEEQSTTLEVI